MSLLPLIMSIILVSVLNVVFHKNSKYLKNKIQWQHYLFGYLLIVYLVICLKLVGFPSLSEWSLLLKLDKPIFNPHINLIPFNDGFDVTNILNIILFIPFGFLLPTLWIKYRKFVSTVCYGLCFSIIIEVSQLFVSNRETDINDIIMNVAGAICGWLIFNIMKKVFHKFTDKTAVHISSSNTLSIRLAVHIYIVIAIICNFCFSII